MPLVNGQMQNPRAHHYNRRGWGWCAPLGQRSYLWVWSATQSVHCLLVWQKPSLSEFGHDLWFLRPSPTTAMPINTPSSPVSSAKQLGPHIIFAICLQLCRLLSSDTLIIDTGVSGWTRSLWVFLRFFSALPEILSETVSKQKQTEFSTSLAACA